MMCLITLRKQKHESFFFDGAKKANVSTFHAQNLKNVNLTSIHWNQGCEGACMRACGCGLVRTGATVYIGTGVKKNKTIIAKIGRTGHGFWPMVGGIFQKKYFYWGRTFRYINGCRSVAMVVNGCNIMYLCMEKRKQTEIGFQDVTNDQKQPEETWSRIMYFGQSENIRQQKSLSWKHIIHVGVDLFIGLVG